jgi:hypothetical protein
MKSQFIIIAILITLKVIGVASRANADYFCHYKDKDYGISYNSDGFNEHGQKSLLRFAQDSECNKKQQKIIKDVIKNFKAKKLNNYLPGYTCHSSTIFQINCGEKYYEANKVSLSYDVCNTEPEFQYINTFNNPTYRCGQNPKFVRI